METPAPDRPRTPLWKATLHVAIATAAGNAVFLVCLTGVDLLPFQLWFGCLAVLMLLQAAVLANGVTSACFVRPGAAVVLSLLAALFLGVLGTWALARGVDTYVWNRVLSIRIVLAAVALVPFPIAGLAFRLLCPSAPRRRVLVAVAFGSGVLVVAEALLIGSVLGWRWLRADIALVLPQEDSTAFTYAVLLTFLLPYSVTTAIVSRRLAQAAKPRDGRTSLVVRHKALGTLIALIAVAAAVVLPVTAHRRLRVHRLLEAIGRGEIAKVAPLLTDASVLRWRNEEGTTPLGRAAWEDRVEMVEFLLARGADVSAKSTLDGTALHDAALLGREEVADLLIARGADPNAENRYGYVPLVSAARYGSKGVVELLLRKGADANISGFGGTTPMHAAAVSLLYGDEMVALLVAAGADVNARGGDGWTPLHEAVRSDHGSAVKALIAHGADVNAKTDQGYTPLDLATNMGHDAIAIDLKGHGGRPGKPAKR